MGTNPEIKQLLDSVFSDANPGAQDQLRAHFEAGVRRDLTDHMLQVLKNLGGSGRVLTPLTMEGFEETLYERTDGVVIASKLHPIIGEGLGFTRQLYIDASWGKPVKATLGLSGWEGSRIPKTSISIGDQIRIGLEAEKYAPDQLPNDLHLKVGLGVGSSLLVAEYRFGKLERFGLLQEPTTRYIRQKLFVEDSTLESLKGASLQEIIDEAVNNTDLAGQPLVKCAFIHLMHLEALHCPVAYIRDIKDIGLYPLTDEEFWSDPRQTPVRLRDNQKAYPDAGTQIAFQLTSGMWHIRQYYDGKMNFCAAIPAQIDFESLSRSIFQRGGEWIPFGNYFRGTRVEIPQLGVDFEIKPYRHETKSGIHE